MPPPHSLVICLETLSHQLSQEIIRPKHKQDIDEKHLNFCMLNLLQNNVKLLVMNYHWNFYNLMLFLINFKNSFIIVRSYNYNLLDISSKKKMNRFWKESYCKDKGRILVASTDIEAGEVVLVDNCIVAAPDGVPVCLKCLGCLPLENVYVSYECAECHWPVCSETCVNSVSEDHLPECEILSKSKITPQTCGSVKLWYSIVPLLRMLILKRDQTKLYWATVGKFESHWDVRQNQTEVVNLIKYIGAFIRKRLQLTWVTDQDVQHVFGVFKTNGVGHVSANSRVCFLYPNVSLMSHSCLSNTEIVSSPARSIQFIAKSKISEGEELTWR